MIRKITFACMLLVAMLQQLQAQSPQYSQYYAAPLYINPALAGSDTKPRFVMNYRNQWPGLEATFTTYSASFDAFIDKASSGIGVIYTTDQVPNGGMRSQDIGLQYAYELKLNDGFSLRAGMQASYVIRDYQFFKLTFPDQFNDQGLIPGKATGEAFPNDTRRYVNASAGLFLYSEKMWLGLATHNLNRPRQDILNISPSNLPIHYSLQAGINIDLESGGSWRDKQRGGFKKMMVTPTLLYKHQGRFDQLDLGAYFTFSPIMFGMWYRGLPIKQFETGLGNNEALVGLLGVVWENMSIGYSYDYTISGLGARTGGAHEVSFRLLLSSPSRGKGQKTYYRNNFPCPKF